jgi:hypothetical protein
MKSTRKGKDTLPKHDTHDDARVVLVRPLVVTAGGSFSHAPLQAARLVMAGNPKPIIEGLPGYTPIIIRLDWPDMSTPDMSAADWNWLAGRIRALRRPLHVSCAMGHGRTGSCLAILAHMWGQIPKGADPVAWLRTAYCSEAIETAGQIAYIERMTGRTSKCRSKMPATLAGVTGSWNPDGYDYGVGYGQSGVKVTGKVTTYVAGGKDNHFPPTSPPAGPAPKVRYCGHESKGGTLCPKPAREGTSLCDIHYMDSLPMPSGPPASRAPVCGRCNDQGWITFPGIGDGHGYSCHCDKGKAEQTRRNALVIPEGGA